MPALTEAPTFEVALSPEGVRWMQQSEENAQELYRCATDFRYFLRYWKFVNQETMKVQTLGELWPSQDVFVTATQQFNWVYFLKARQLGETTIACAYDAWVLRFRAGGKNARVHVFSKREKEAQSLLGRVKFGLENLPAHLRLPVAKDTVNEYHLLGGPEDTRKAVAYPADNDTARGETCVHAHIDEWAFMGNPSKVWQAIEPSAAGTVHFITTGQGPASFTSSFWMKCMAGDVIDRYGVRCHPCFIDALQRPDRNMQWLRNKRSGGENEAVRWEYPMTWQDALSGAGGYAFKTVEVDAAGQDAYGLQSWRAGRKYIIAWDIGRHADAAVGIVLDVTEDVFDVAAYIRLRENTYPQIQREIKVLHEAYPGTLTVIEDNAAGEAVRENLDIPERQVLGFKTTKPSKARIIYQLRLRLQHQTVKWLAAEVPNLDAEVRGYQIPDDDVVQDSVMALAIAIEHADRAYATGRVMAVSSV